MTLHLSGPDLPAGALPVNEVFQTIQGEGQWCGTPSVFIRLQGCPVGCAFCDTKFTWELEASDETTSGDILLKEGSGTPAWAKMDPDMLLALMRRYRAQHTVITGGEPCMHDLTPLTTALVEASRTAQIETSGTYPIRCHPHTWVTVSPKVGMPGGLAVLPEALARANEIKFPVGKQDDIQALLDMLGQGDVPPTARIYLQPLSLSRKATDLCVQNAIANNWRLSIQTHALLGWR